MRRRATTSLSAAAVAAVAAASCALVGLPGDGAPSAAPGAAGPSGAAVVRASAPAPAPAPVVAPPPAVVGPEPALSATPVVPVAAPWSPAPDASTTAPAPEVVADAPAAGPVRVTAVVDAGGRPEVRVLEAADRADAERLVGDAQALPGVVAVDVDVPVRLVGTAGDAATPAPPAPSATPAVSASPEAPVPDPQPSSPAPEPEAPSAPAEPAAPPTGATRPAAAAEPPDAGSAATGTDPSRAQQWGLDRLRASTAWTAGSARAQVVAVLDTGVDGTHPDLAGVLVPGIDVLGLGDAAADRNGHGTHVAGVVAAVRGNGVGGAGISDARVMPVRVLDDLGTGYTSDVARGIVRAVDAGAHVVTLSLSAERADATLRSAVAYAASRDVVVVAAAGNSRTAGNPVTYPAAYDDVLAVAAVDRTDVPGAFSQSGPYVDVAAPGVSILSTVPAGGYAAMTGTSMAAPFVAGTAALVRAVRPSLSAAAVAGALTATADDLAAPGRDDETGAGLVSPVRALCLEGCGSTPATDPGTERTALERYVDRAYLDLLGRAADAGGRSFWSGLIATGTPRAAVTDGLVTAPEYRAARVRAVYARVFGRQPDPGGLDHWVGRVSRGATLQQMEAEITGSPEYYARAGGTDRAFVAAMFRHALGREVDAAGSDFWTAVVGRPGTDRARVALGILTSEEGLSRVLAGHYADLLGRGIDEGGRRYWVARMLAGQREETFVGLLIGSDEYFAAAQA